MMRQTNDVAANFGFWALPPKNLSSQLQCLVALRGLASTPATAYGALGINIDNVFAVTEPIIGSTLP